MKKLRIEDLKVPFDVPHSEEAKAAACPRYWEEARKRVLRSLRDSAMLHTLKMLGLI